MTPTVSCLVVRNVVEKLTTSLLAPVWRPVDYSIYDPLATTLWGPNIHIQLESPFNNTVPRGLFRCPYGAMYRDAHSTWESIVGGNVGGPRYACSCSEWLAFNYGRFQSMQSH